MSSVARNIRRLRISHHMTQEDLAGKMYVTRQAVSNWETGKNQPDTDTLIALAEVFGTDANELIYGTAKGDWPRFQNKYVRAAVICGAVFILMLGLHEWFLPYLKKAVSDIYSNWGERLSGYEFYFIPLFSEAGMAAALSPLILSVLSFRFDIRTACRKFLVLIGILLLIPVVFLVVEYAAALLSAAKSFRLAWLVFAGYKWMRVPLFMIMPFIAGVLFFLWYNRKKDE